MKYVILTSADKNFEKENRWYARCIYHKVPFIIVRQRSVYADVHFDRDPNHGKIFYESSTQKMLKDLNRKLAAKYKPKALENSGFVVTFFGLLIPDALKLADELYDQLDEFMEQHIRQPLV